MVRTSLQHSAAFLKRIRHERVLASGFTLIELLVVMAAIAILSGVVLAMLGGARQKGRDAQRIGDMKRIQTALTLYYDKNDQYPATIGSGGSSVLVTGRYMDNLPLDPMSHTPYPYAAFVNSTTGNASLCSSYHLGTDLENSSHSELGNDADSYVSYNGSSAIAGETLNTSAALCFGSAPDFHGSDATGNKCNSSDTGVVCYDVRP